MSKGTNQQHSLRSVFLNRNPFVFKMQEKQFLSWHLRFYSMQSWAAATIVVPWRANGVKPNCWRLVCCCECVYKGLLLHGANSPLKGQGGQDVERKRGMKLKKQGRTFSLTWTWACAMQKHVHEHELKHVHEYVMHINMYMTVIG